MDLQHLTNNFSIPGVLAFNETGHGLIRATITMEARIVVEELPGE